MASYTLLLLLASCCGALASHFYSGVLTFTPKGKNPDGSFRVEFRYKRTFHVCYQGNTWQCSNGNCGNIDRFELGEVDRSPTGVSYRSQGWCQSEAVMTRNIPNNKPFEMRKSGCCWIYNSLSSGAPWRLLTHVDLGIRSDTQEPNRSPVTTILPFIRIPQNCHRTLYLLAHDPDKDQVRCRYGNSHSNECYYCYQHPGFHLDQNACTLSNKNTASQSVHAFEIVLEDYPRQQITLSYTDGTMSIKSPLVTRHKRSYGHMVTAAPTAGWWWNQPNTTPTPHWGSHHQNTPSPWWWNQPNTTPIPYWRSHHQNTPSPWWWNQPNTTPTPHWRSHHQNTPSPWWWNQPNTTPTPHWKSHHQNTPSSWWWYQPTTTRSTTQPTTTTLALTTTSHGPSTGPLSKIPLHFAIQVDPPVYSCTAGLILPQLLYPTPRNGEILNASVNQELEIRLKAAATQSWMNNFIISGPLNITKYNTINGSVGESLIRWTPTENDFGDQVPICFIAESLSGSRIFHSEMRCIIVIVGHTYGNANVVCNETTMTVEVEKASIIGLHEDHLRLIDPSCTPISNGTHVIAAVSLSSCGTELEEDADNLIFKNEIMSFDNIGDVITRKHQVEIGFSCTYPKKGRVSLEFRAHKIPYVFTEKGFGKFTYQFEFFHSNLFNRMVDTDSYPVEVALQEMLYMEIKATSSIANTKVFVESCRATPVDDPNYHIFYDIFGNGCSLDETVVVYPSNPSEFKFGIEAFKFIGQHEEVFISCSVILCVAGDPTTRCSQGCINATAAPVVHHHHRRAVATESVRHSISQGPLRIKRTTDITVSNMGLNMNLVFIAAVLLVVVATVCGAVIYTVKRPKVKYQPLPSTDF
ncbi:uncharacterized protein LOC133111714 [Conger conger]|uniref:uncharacterized protein LOC133111714 n=1 Tax=Conger conger TaxID=82655 RepID=UPI002A5B0AE0|nr:uncharacterized protein LOC133111714 [Conger conger]